MENKADRKYQKSHEWVLEKDGVYVIGISHYAQESLGDIVFVELPEVGATFSQGSAFGVVESVKAASDIFLPLGGEITAVNQELADKPELINEDPFEAGWIVAVKAADPAELEDLMDSSAYDEYIKDLDE